ncbi:MAG: hypothetical protein WBF89_22945 [Steroidobacteraceae bacterium]
MMGVTFSPLTASGFGRAAFAGAGFTGTAFATAGFVTAGFVIADLAIADLTIAGLAIAGLGTGLLGFTGTFDVGGDGLAFAGGRSTFLRVAALCAAFLGAALPGRLAALLGFFEGI